uniref:Uncharacterized protein n=1 Tax=Timema tahoe TaxID=61484 RepID=A0A7R9FG37_9NEOP|nr:unnamed protein product [Timema tahoe]
MEKPVKKKVIVRKRREAREKGQPYINSRGKEIPAKQPPAEQASCSCKYECKNISSEQKQLLFLEFYKVDEESQGTYLLNHIQMLPIGRRRHGTYENPAESGHSYTNCDRDFGVIEKKRKAAKAITPKDLEALVASLAKDYLNTKDLTMSKISHFRISHKNPSTVKVASVLGLEGDVMVAWKKVDVLKKNANLDNVPDIHDLPKIHFKSKISREKKNDILGMIDYIEKEEDKDFYRALLENKDEEACNMEVSGIDVYDQSVFAFLVSRVYVFMTETILNLGLTPRRKLMNLVSSLERD